MSNAKELLTHFSVTEEEAEIYLGLLRLGMATATEISDKTKANRTATHFHLKKLVDKDLVTLTQKGRTMMFRAVSPADLAARFDRMTTDFKSLVPQLEAMKVIDAETPKVQVSESRAGYFAVYDEISSLPEGSTFYAMEGAEALKNELSLLSPEAANAFYTKMVERKIEVKLILTDEATRVPQAAMAAETLALFQKRRIDARVHSESVLPFQGLTLVYGDTVSHLIPGKDLVITFRHQAITESYRATFDALFSFGTPYSFQA
jgi:sugar-specific transcriptional regulator TrmB